ncbi:hypothetical protein [Tautonia plasticadhaerens]|uniref:hypothetical protein n=1 Tax=Tautonia plasticadhaerens TaxID=2527974 RepID=UPI0018D24259|nr:hypothetical protein [Tautonia plasticadhaerens]
MSCRVGAPFTGGPDLGRFIGDPVVRPSGGGDLVELDHGKAATGHIMILQR